MVADIIKVWPGSTWTKVLVKDHADGVTKSLKIWMVDELGPWLGSACRSAKGPVVLTLNPPEDGESEIVDVEKFAEEVA